VVLNRFARTRGMTLIEVLVALVLLTIGLFGVFDLYGNVAHQMARGHRDLRASYLAEGYVASLQTAGYLSLATKIQTLSKTPDVDSVSLYPEFTYSKIDRDFKWNAVLRRDTVNRRIAIEVNVRWAHSLQTESPSVRKAIGYVFSP